MGRFGRLIILLIAVGASLLLFQWLYLGDAAPREVWHSVQESVKEHVHGYIAQAPKVDKSLRSQTERI